MPKQLTLAGIRLQDNATFENFYAKQNQQVFAFLHDLFLSDENYTYLWGNTGAGCSHLLQASCHNAHDLNKQAMYLPLKEFIHLTPDVFENLEIMDLVAIDDIQCVAGKANWEEALFHLFNRLRANKCYLIIGANTPPNSLNILLPDLLSRLTWGITFKLNGLIDDDKVAALCMRATHRGMHMPEEVANYLLRHYSRTTSHLFTALDKLDLASLAQQRKLTIPFVKQVLS